MNSSISTIIEMDSHEDINKIMEIGSLMNHFVISDSERDEIFKERARKLAKKHDKEKNTDKLKLVEFLIGDDKYAIESRFVKAVMLIKELTPIPCTPDFVLGVTLLRSRLISVIDLKKFLNVPSKGLTDQNRLMIIRNDSMEIGILTDVVEEIKWLHNNDIMRSPEHLDTASEYYIGITSAQLKVLDGDFLLNHSDMLVREIV
ncbi:purine-binding chemotaxis protein CheW [bacterium]|nr:purine-binding chemotaxis protein CheW [bacterium]